MTTKTRKKFALISAIIIAVICTVHVVYATWVPFCINTGATTNEPPNSPDKLYAFSFRTPDTDFYTQIDGAYFNITCATCTTSTLTMEFSRANVNGEPIEPVLRTVVRQASSLPVGGSANPRLCDLQPAFPASTFFWQFSSPYTVAPSNLYVFTFFLSGGNGNHFSLREGIVAPDDGINPELYYRYMKSTNGGDTWSQEPTVSVSFLVSATGDGTIPPTPTPIPAEKAVRSFADDLGFTDSNGQFLFGIMITALIVFVMLAIGAGFVIAGGTGAITFLAFVGLEFIPDQLLLAIVVIVGLLLVIGIASKLKADSE